MNSEHEKQLETEIDLILKSLPELRAPGTLVARVQAALELRAVRPWYRQSWQHWPLAVRFALFGFLMAFFVALCWGGWLVPRTAQFSDAVQPVTAWTASASGVLGALNTLGTAAVLVFKHMGSGFLLGCVGGVLLVWVMCVGLGTAWVRLALARRD